MLGASPQEFESLILRRADQTACPAHTVAAVITLRSWSQFQARFQCLTGRSETIELSPLSQGKIDQVSDGFVEALFRHGVDLQLQRHLGGWACGVISPGGGG